MLATTKKLAIFTVFSLGLVSYANADDSAVLSLGVTSNHSTLSYPGAESKSKGYGTLATLSKPVLNGWIGTGILGYSNYDVDVNTNSGTKEVDVSTLGLAASKSIGNGRSISFSALYGKISIDSAEILSGLRATDTSDVRSLILSGGLAQIIPTTSNSYTTLSATLTQVTNTTKAYTAASGTAMPKSKYDMTYLSLGTKQTWNVSGYKPYASLQYNISNEEFSAGTGDKSYYRWGVGTTKDIAKDMTLGLSFSKIFGKDYASSDSLGFNFIKKF
jgi:Autotransporter beta-domain